jgi:Uma2 family endonuclease
MAFGWPGYFTTQLYRKYRGLCLCHGKRLCVEFMLAAFGRPLQSVDGPVHLTRPTQATIGGWNQASSAIWRGCLTRWAEVLASPAIRTAGISRIVSSVVGLAMSSPARNEMDVDAYLLWAEGRDGRWELRDGQPVLMAPERALHALVKYAAQETLKAAIRKAGLPCLMFPDGMTVRMNPRTAFEPDALVVCAPPTDLNTMEIPNPVIVVEVLSPSTAADDHGIKLDGYFSLGSVFHYLILDPDRRVMIHHRRGHAGAIETRVLREGVVILDPPGFEAQVAAFFATE